MSKWIHKTEKCPACSKATLLYRPQPTVPRMGKPSFRFIKSCLGCLKKHGVQPSGPLMGLVP